MMDGERLPSAMLLAPGRRNGDVLRASLAYMVAGLASMLLMGLLGLLMRLDQAGMLIISPTWFYRVMTLHGSGMIASVLLAAMGGIAAAVSPTTRLSARALWIALVIYTMGNGFVVLATLVGGSPADGRCCIRFPNTASSGRLAPRSPSMRATCSSRWDYSCSAFRC